MAKLMKKRRNNTPAIMTLVDMILILAGLVFVIFVTIMGYSRTMWYKLLVVALVVCYSAMCNVTALYTVRAFETMTKRQGKNYVMYMLFDALALCFLALFVVNADRMDEPFHYVSLGMFLILTIPRSILYHRATDEPKRVWKRRVTSLRGKVLPTKSTEKKPSMRTPIGRETSEQFESPQLHTDRFVQMNIEDFIGGPSVDEKDNIRLE